MSTKFEPYTNTTATEITVQLRPALPETHIRHLRAYLEAVIRPNRLSQLLARLFALPLQHIIIFLFVADPAAKTFDFIIQYVIGVVLIDVIPTYLYAGLIRPNDHTLTLSATTGYMSLTRCGCTQPRLDLPLANVIQFRTINRKTVSHLPANTFLSSANLIQVTTTDHPILLGDSIHSYQFIVPLLNQFLQRHRDNGTIPRPTIHLAYHPNRTAIPYLPILTHNPTIPPVHLNFHHISPTSFKVVRPNKFDSMHIASAVTIRFLYDYTPFKYIFNKLSAEPKPCPQFNSKWYIPCLFIKNIPMAVYTFLLIKRPSPTWIFTNTPRHFSSIRDALHSIINRQYATVPAYSKVSITPYEHWTHPEALSTSRDPPQVRNILYAINFSVADRVVQSVNGFSHDETICILSRLKHHFPFLFATENTIDHHLTNQPHVAQLYAT